MTTENWFGQYYPKSGGQNEKKKDNGLFNPQYRFIIFALPFPFDIEPLGFVDFTRV